jgi:hypothetical protein
MATGGMVLATRLENYEATAKSLWDEFVATSRQGTFLFKRDYMQYHQDRYKDFSLLIYDEDDLMAVLPANASVETYETHGGLTYGGFITNERMTQSKMLAAFESVTRYLRQKGFDKVLYKAMPHIYHKTPSEEDLYALFRMGARLVRRDASTVVTCIYLDSQKQRNIKKAERMAWGESQDYEGFWAILEDNLWARHHVKPAHTVEEMRLLASRFPEIKLYTATLEHDIVAGAVMYETPMVAHVQYSASSEVGRHCRAMSYLMLQLLNLYHHSPYFDFGISTESQGRVLNDGLVAFKEGYGGHTVTYDHYELDL